MISIGEKIKSDWKSQGLPISLGNPEEKIAEFESKYEVVMPNDMQDYFIQVDGLDSRYMDKNGFTFWSLSIVTPLTEECSEDAYLGLEDANKYFVFADCYAWSWAYAIKMTKSLSNENPVIVIGIDKYPIRIAHSFKEFIELYLAYDSKLFGEMGKEN